MTSPTVIKVVRQGPAGPGYRQETLTAGAGTKTPNTTNYTHGHLVMAAGGAITLAMGSPGGSVLPMRYIFTVFFDAGAKATSTISMTGTIFPSSITITGLGANLVVQFDYSPAALAWYATKLIDD